MKRRPLTLKLVVVWCGFYAFLMLVKLSQALQGLRMDFAGALLTLISFACFAYGTSGLRHGKAHAGWLCAGALGVLTLFLPEGYLRVASQVGKDPNRLFVTFSVWCSINLLAIGYLVSPAYRTFCKTWHETSKPSS